MKLSFKKIDKRRTEIGMPVTKFSKNVGISRKTYYDWRSGIEILAKYTKVIEGVLGIDINDISEEDKSKLPEHFLRGLNTNIHEIRDRIKWAVNYIITEHNFSNVKLANMVGLSPSTIDAYRRGVKGPKLEFLMFIQNKHNISMDWIMDGTGERFTGTHSPSLDRPGPDPSHREHPSTILNESSDEFVFIRRFQGKISAGGGLSPDDDVDVQLAFRRDWIKKKGSPGNMSLIKVSGDSMAPTLLSGDLILVDHSRISIAPQGGIYAIAIDHEIMIKRIQLLFLINKLKIISDNKHYESIEADPDQVKINGKVIWFCRDIER